MTKSVGKLEDQSLEHQTPGLCRSQAAAAAGEKAVTFQGIEPGRIERTAAQTFEPRKIETFAQPQRHQQILFGHILRFQGIIAREPMALRLDLREPVFRRLDGRERPLNAVLRDAVSYTHLRA